MCRAGGFAGGSAGFVAVLAVVGDIVLVPLVLAPFQAGGQFLLGIADFSILGAELLSQLNSTGRAYLHTLAAGHTVVLVDMGAVGGSGEIRGIEQLAGAQCETYAQIAVAQAKNFICAVNICNLMDVTVLFSTLANCKCLFLCDTAALACFHQIVCVVAKSDAAVVQNLTGAFTRHAACVAAGAVAHGKVVIFVKPV